MLPTVNLNVIRLNLSATDWYCVDNKQLQEHSSCTGCRCIEGQQHSVDNVHHRRATAGLQVSVDHPSDAASSIDLSSTYPSKQILKHCSALLAACRVRLELRKSAGQAHDSDSSQLGGCLLGTWCRGCTIDRSITLPGDLNQQTASAVLVDHLYPEHSRLWSGLPQVSALSSGSTWTTTSKHALL